MLIESISNSLTDSFSPPLAALVLAPRRQTRPSSEQDWAASNTQRERERACVLENAHRLATNGLHLCNKWRSHLLLSNSGGVIQAHQSLATTSWCCQKARSTYALSLFPQPLLELSSGCCCHARHAATGRHLCTTNPKLYPNNEPHQRRGNLFSSSSFS